MKNTISTFINRAKELDWLENYYKKTNTEAQLLIIYGRRRIGKTELVRHFAKNKPVIYFLATRTTSIRLLEAATKVLTDGLGLPKLPTQTFSTWREFFDYFGPILKKQKKPLILVFDEFSLMAESDIGMSSYFQYGWDMYIKDSKIMLILMGSSISMMYKHTLVYSAPLYGRRTGQWQLKPFTYSETKNFYPNCSFENTFSLYAISGGVPAYARIFNGNQSLRKNITEHILTENSFLAVEPELLLSDELSEPRSYISILQAIGLGRTKLSEIAQAARISITSLPGYLKTLIYLRLVCRETSITEPIPEKSKKSGYSLSDPFLRFYFSFIYPNTGIIKGKNPTAIFSLRSEILTRFIAKAYEDETEEFINQAIVEKHLPLVQQMGRWWDKNHEIDLVGFESSSNTILFAETKWNDKPIGTEVLNSLRNKSKQVVWGKPGRKEYFALIAKGGFSKELINMSKKEKIVLIFKDKIIKF